jgi:N-carbamoylputrescine amidase
VCAVNRVGHEVIVGEGLEFWGGSFVSDPFGRVLAKGSTDREEVLVVTCDRKLMEDVRRNWPFFRDRRIDAYAGITRRVAD